MRGQRVPEAGDGHEVVQEAATGEQIGGRVGAGRERVLGLIHQALSQQEPDCGSWATRLCVINPFPMTFLLLHYL